MTDEQIMRGFECCYTSKGYCHECPYSDIDLCVSTLNNDILDMMQRQKDENRWLTKRIEQQNEQIAELIANLEAARADAVKEFADKLKARMFEDEYRVPDLSRFDVEEVLSETLTQVAEET